MSTLVLSEALNLPFIYFIVQQLYIEPHRGHFTFLFNILYTSRKTEE